MEGRVITNCGQCAYSRVTRDFNKPNAIKIMCDNVNSQIPSHRYWKGQIPAWCPLPRPGNESLDEVQTKKNPD